MDSNTMVALHMVFIAASPRIASLHMHVHLSWLWLEQVGSVPRGEWVRRGLNRQHAPGVRSPMFLLF